MLNRNRVIFFLLGNFIFSGHLAMGSIRYQKAQLDKAGIYLANGIFVGGTGKSKGPWQIIGVRSYFDGKFDSERIVFDLSAPINRSHGRLSPFYCGLRDAGQRVTIDFTELKMEKNYNEFIEKLVQSSKVIQSASFTNGFSASTIGIELILNSKVIMEAFELPQTTERPSRLVIDLKVFE